MTLRVALQMDAIEGINPKGDTTLRLSLEAQRRGHALFYYQPDALTLHSAQGIQASGHAISLTESLTDWHTLQSTEMLDLESMDVVLLRQDPPYDMPYLTTTYLLERLKRPLVLNHPASVRSWPEKLSPFDFSEYMPPTLVSSQPEPLRRFWQEQGEIVLKPLYGFGGHGVFHIDRQGNNMDALLELLLQGRAEPLVAQKFLPQVKDQDRRIILINGEVKACFGRTPQAGAIRANMRVGGAPVVAPLTERQRDVCAKVGPELRARGLMLAGLDMIGDWLTEINITSPTGLAAYTALTGEKLEIAFWDAVEEQLQARNSV